MLIDSNIRANGNICERVTVELLLIWACNLSTYDVAFGWEFIDSVSLYCGILKCQLGLLCCGVSIWWSFRSAFALIGQVRKVA